MSIFNTARTLRSLRRAVWFSFVTAPSLALFITFAFLSFNNSLAGTFLQEARRLVTDAPDGRVWGCTLPNKQLQEERTPPVPSVSPLCERVAVDAVTWQQSVDRLLRNLYLVFVVAGAGLLWLFNGESGTKAALGWAGKKLKTLRKTAPGKD